MSGNNQETADKLGIEALSFIPYVFIIPITIYCNFKLWQYKSAMFVQKRSVFIVFGLNMSMFAVIVTGINSQLGIIYQIGIFLSRTTPMVTSWIAVLFFLTTKNWLIYWRYNWQYYTLQLKWQKLINSNITNNQTYQNTFIKYNHKYGRVSFTAKICSIFFIFILTNNILFYVLTEFGYVLLARILGTFGMLGLLVMVIAYFVIVCKTPHYDDTYFIHWESKIQSKMLLMTCVGTLVLVCIVLLVEVHERSYLILASFLFPMVAVSFCIMSYISTIVIIQKNTIDKTHDISNNINEKNISIELDSVSASNNIDIIMILSDKESVNLFMLHLSKEYSMELLLSVIEISQFQDYLIRNDDTNQIEQYIKNKVQILNFASNIPLSQIIENTDDNIQLKAYKIYKKYIENSSEFELNISSFLRSQISTLFEQFSEFESNIDINRLLLVLEDCKDAMRTLLLFSLTRFKNTVEFDQVRQIFNEEMTHVQ